MTSNSLKSEVPSIGRIWDIAWPIIISLLAQNIVGVTDTAFLGRVGEVELGASAIGGLFYVILFMVGFGFTTGVQILIARRFGEKNYPEIGRIFDNSLYFLTFTSLVVMAVIYLAGKPALSLMVSSPEIFKASIVYLNYRIPGLFFATTALLFRSFYTGITYTRYLSISSVIMAGINIILDYILIFGKLGFPEMGIAGAAIASVISEACSFVFLFLVTFRNPRTKPFVLFKWVRPQWAIIKSTLDVAIFVMIQHVFSLSVWFAFFLIIEKMGERALAISNIGRSVYMFLMIPGWALSSVTNTLVSNALGEGKPQAVLPITFKIMKFAAVILIVFAGIAAFFPRQIVGIFTADATLISAALPTYRIILLALVLFSVMMILFNAALGTANTRVTLVIELITLSFYVIYTWFVVIKMKQPVHVAWTAEWVYASLIGIFSYLYLKKGRWKEKVI